MQPHPDGVDTWCPEDGYTGTQLFQRQSKAPQVMADCGCPGAPSVGKVLTGPFSFTKRGHEHLCPGTNIPRAPQANPKELRASLRCWYLPPSPPHAGEGGLNQ